MGQGPDWVEVVGLPGCGKTTLIRGQKASLAYHYRIIESRAPSFFSRIRSRAIYHCKLGREDIPLALAQKLSYRLSFQPLNKNVSAFFYDSGLMQVVLEYLITTDFAEKEGVISLLRNLPLPGKVVFVTDNIEAIISRELNRKVRRYPDLGPEILTQRYKTAENLIKERLLPLADHVYPVNLAGDTNLIRVLKGEKLSEEAL